MRLSELFTFLTPGNRLIISYARTGPGTKKVGKLVTKRAVLSSPLTRQLRRQQERLAAKGRALA